MKTAIFKMLYSLVLFVATVFFIRAGVFVFQSVSFPFWVGLLLASIGGGSFYLLLNMWRPNK